MLSVNNVQLAGNITRDIDVKYTQAGVAYGETTLAVNDSWKDQTGEWKQKANFIFLAIRHKRIEDVAEKIKKGDNVYLEGKLSVDNYKDQAGNPKTFTKIWVSKFRLVQKKGTGHIRSEAPVSAQSHIDDETPF